MLERWVEGAALDWETLPVRVEAVIAERVGRLPERLRDALRVASVEGETFTAEVVARVEEAEERETVRRLSDTLDEKYRLVSAKGILRLDGQRLSRYRFRHILYQKHLYSSLDQVQRVPLHQAVGTALEMLYGEGMGEVGSAAPQLAWHFREAGIAEKLASLPAPQEGQHPAIAAPVRSLPEPCGSDGGTDARIYWHGAGEPGLGSVA